MAGICAYADVEARGSNGATGIWHRPSPSEARPAASSVIETGYRAPRHLAFSQLLHLGVDGTSVRSTRSPIGVWLGGPGPREEISTHGSDRGCRAPWMQTAALLATNGARARFRRSVVQFSNEPLVGTVECSPANSNFRSPWRDICPRSCNIGCRRYNGAVRPWRGPTSFLSVAHGSAHHARYAPPTHLESDRWTLASSC
jgi:hypothetical protein